MRVTAVLMVLISLFVAVSIEAASHGNGMPENKIAKAGWLPVSQGTTNTVQQSHIASGSRVLRLEFRRRKGFLEMRAGDEMAASNHSLNDAGKKLTRRMNRLNTMLENYGRHGDEEFKTELKELGAIFYDPVKSAILEADIVAIGISPEIIRFPFEHLYFQEKPLGLQKPIVVYFPPLPAQSFSFAGIKSAQVLADLTADPEEACRTVAKRLRNAEYRSLDDIDTDFLMALAPHDLLLASVHGSISFDEADCIEYDEESIYPKSWAKTAPMLAYFDSCQVGVSNAFVETFKAAGTQYFIAPITSNEAGNSSTRTIENFFAGLIAGESPERALFQTKLRLFDHYSAGKKSSYGELLYRVMPFRAYRLN